MSLLQRLRIGRARAEEEVLAAQLTDLQAALARCKQVAARWKRKRRGLTLTLSLLMLTLGFVLGVYSKPVKHEILTLLSRPESNDAAAHIEAGNAAYEKGNYHTALQLIRPLAEEGDPRAQSMLGLLYYRGRGVPQDDAQALKWFRSAAEAGDALAQLNLGVMYADGRGVPQDNKEAANWYRRAADQGNPQAQYNLGLWYAQGEGGRPDKVRAHMWFNLAAARFPPSDSRSRAAAVTSRDAVASNMTAEEIAQAQRLAREWKPSH
jgi:TPR repeat protein